MKSESGSLVTLAAFFAVTSLFAVCGGNSVIPEIGYHVAGIAGAVVATLAMCGPNSMLAFIVGRGSERFTGAAWHGAFTRGLVPVMLGLTAASAAVIVSVADYNWVAAAITLATACIALRVHPLWAFAAAALLGLFGLV
jgi:chromate transporter